MAEVIWGLATSHVPSIGAAMDRGKTDDPNWKALFDGYAPARAWLAEHRPDVAIVVYNDHANGIDLDFVPDLRARHRRALRGRRRGLRPPAGARRDRRPRAVPAPGGEPDRRALRPDRLPGAARRPRVHRAAVGLDARPRRRMAVPGHPAAGQRHPVPPAHGGPVLRARPGARPGDPQLPEGRHRRRARYRWHVAPAGRRAGRVHQPGLRRHVDGDDRDRPGDARRRSPARS